MDTESLYVMSGVCGMLVVGIVIVSYFLLEHKREKKCKGIKKFTGRKKSKSKHVSTEI